MSNSPETKPPYTDRQKQAILENPGFPTHIVAEFADAFLEIKAGTGKTLDEHFKGEILLQRLLPATPGSIQELFPHLRNPNYV